MPIPIDGMSEDNDDGVSGAFLVTASICFQLLSCASAAFRTHYVPESRYANSEHTELTAS